MKICKSTILAAAIGIILAATSVWAEWTLTGGREPHREVYHIYCGGKCFNLNNLPASNTLTQNFVGLTLKLAVVLLEENQNKS